MQTNNEVEKAEALESRMPEARSALHEFIGFVRELDTSSLDPGDIDLLQDYMSLWLEFGDAVEATFGEFAPTYLLTLVAIIDEYARDPSILDYRSDGVVRERRVEGIVDLLDHGSICFDRGVYERKKWRRLCQRA